MKKYLSILIAVMISITLFYCTKNPFGSDTIISKDEIRGKVILSDGASPDSVYVWLEGFNISTWTNRKGDFKIKLPSVEAQAGGGLTGAYNIYFYMANYDLDSATVVVRSGILERSHGDLSESGRLKHTIKLVKILDIQTKVSPSYFPLPSNLDWWEYEEKIDVEVTLKATVKDTIITQFPSPVKGPVSVLFVKKVSPGENCLRIYETTPLGNEFELTYTKVTSDPKKWTGGFKLMIGDLPLGKYKIIPYFLIYQKAIPEKLLESFGPEALKYGPKYLSIPFRREGGDFEVRR